METMLDFFKKMKESKLNSNRASLDVYVDQIKILFGYINDGIKEMDFQVDNLFKTTLDYANQAIVEINYETADDELNSYIRFGELFKFLIEEFAHYNYSTLKPAIERIILKYNSIAEKCGDQRISDIADVLMIYVEK